MCALIQTKKIETKNEFLPQELKPCGMKFEV